MKKMISVLIATLLLCCVLFITLYARTFADIPEGAYYADAAERMSEKGILSGFGDGRYYGDWELTRAQFAALACKLLGKVDEAVALAGKTAFVDVPENHWSTGYVNYAVANKIINGDGDGNFRPDDSVKYEEAIKVIVCVLEPDNNIVIDSTDWSKNFITEAENLGILNNLVGKKGEFMKRSDIAVIADAAYAVLEKAEENVDNNVETTKKPINNKPTSSNKKDDAETTVEVTTAVTTEQAEQTTTNSIINDGNRLPSTPIED